MPVGFAQLINGHAWDFSSVTITVSTPAPVILTRIASINYEDSLTPSPLRGNSAHKLARSRGQYEASGSMSLYREEFDLLLIALTKAPFPTVTAGYMEKSFKVIVSYGEAASVPSTDELIGCRITRRSSQNQQGSDPIMVDVDLDIMKIRVNGASAVRDKSGIV